MTITLDAMESTLFLNKISDRGFLVLVLSVAVLVIVIENG